METEYEWFRRTDAAQRKWHLVESIEPFVHDWGRGIGRTSWCGKVGGYEKNSELMRCVGMPVEACADCVATARRMMKFPSEKEQHNG